MSAIPTEYPPATDNDFVNFTNFADSTAGWSEAYSSERVHVWDQKVIPSLL